MSTASAVEAPPATSGRGLNIGLWVVQALLAFAFFGAGAMKTFVALDELAKNMVFVNDSPAALVRFIGVSEVLGAVGLILPRALGILPILTPVAAACLALVMVLAAVMHASYGDFAGIPANVILGGMALFVAWGRGTRP